LVHYVDDTFVIWPHKTKKLERLLNHLNGLHRNIQFTMETERDGHPPVLDISIYRRLDGSLGHKVYQKSTHINLYLNSGSHHHPSNIQAVFQCWCYVTRKASMMSWSSSKPLSGKWL
jgi:hypothetical protein